MMKRLFSILFATLFAVAAMAVPAKKFVRTVAQPDGTTVDITLVGDEFFSYYMTVDGVPVAKNAEGAYCYARCEKGIFHPTATLAHDAAMRGAAEQAVAEAIKALPIEMSERAQAIRTQEQANRMRRAPQGPSNALGGQTIISGSKKGVILLAEFPDKKMVHTRSEFQAQMSENGYNKNGHVGSLRDYFYDQSYGQFDVDFDVFGPYMMPQPLAYYGAHAGDDHDCKAAQVIVEAVHAADRAGVDFSKYDWNGDGNVDQVFVIFAGYAEAQGGPDESIWPHEWNLYSAYYYGRCDESYFQVDGKWIMKYACSSELRGYQGTQQEGIGTAAHEFSHCLGLPDFYDTGNQNSPGMSSWSLMCAGNYRNNSAIPAPYTSYERWLCGWLEPTELKQPCRVDSIQTIVSSPDAYVVYNDRNKNEFYIVENHNTEYTGDYAKWDTGLPGHGMLVIHVDYNRNAWQGNTVNTDPNHQRVTFVPANNSKGFTAGVLYPGTRKNTQLSNDSYPAATVYSRQLDGSYNLNHSFTSIADVNGLISFKFDGGVYVATPEVYDATNVTDSSFIANWSEVDLAETYTLQVFDQEKFGKDTILCEDIAHSDAFLNRVTSDASAKINDYLTAGGWKAVNAFIDEHRLRLGTTSKAGKLESKLLPAPEDGKIRLNVGIQKYLTNATNFYVRIVNADGQVLKSVTLTPTEEPETHKLLIDSIYSDYKLVFLTQTKQAFVTFIECLVDANSIVMEGLTGTSCEVTGLEPKSYVYRVKAVSPENESHWSETVVVSLNNGEDGIEAPTQDLPQNALYNLSGQRVVSPQRGVYIMNNQKVLLP